MALASLPLLGRSRVRYSLATEKRNETRSHASLLRHRHWTGSPRSAADPNETFLPLQHPVWRAAEYSDLPGLYWHAWLAARHESKGVRAGPKDRRGFELPDTIVHEMGSEKLLLPRPAQGLPDQPIRLANV